MPANPAKVDGARLEIPFCGRDVLMAQSIIDRVTQSMSPTRRRATLGWAIPGAFVVLMVWAVEGFFGTMRNPEYAQDGTVAGAVGTGGSKSVGTSDSARDESSRDLNVALPPNGTEARLLGFIRSPEPLTTPNWFEFDRLTFETGSAVVGSASLEQLWNVAAILKEYPETSVKIGGYTDDTGLPAANMELSQRRAEAVRDELELLGVDGSRITTEGYGDQHPIADNGTVEGRAQNRRVAISVTAK